MSYEGRKYRKKLRGNEFITVRGIKGQQFEMAGSMHEAGDTSTVLDITITRRQMRIKAMGTEQNYDSDSAHHRNHPSIGKSLMEGIGEKNQLVVNRSGVVIASDGRVRRIPELPPLRVKK